MNLLDLFSGIGGFHLGFKMAGYEFDWVGYSEIDEYANKVYRKNFPDAVALGDITKLKGADLPSVDVLTGGFPCQDISYAGKGAGITGKGQVFGQKCVGLLTKYDPESQSWRTYQRSLLGGLTQFSGC